MYAARTGESKQYTHSSLKTLSTTPGTRILELFKYSINGESPVVIFKKSENQEA